MTVLFDNQHIKEYPQAKCVGLRFDYPYDQSLYPFVGFNGPDALFDAPKSLADLCLETGMVKSRAELRRLLKSKGIAATRRFGEPWEDFLTPIPRESGEYEVRKGQRILQVVVEVPYDDPDSELTQG